MKLKDFIKNINNMVKNNPEFLDLDVIYSVDDEGNSFHYIFYEPSVGFLDEDGDFYGVYDIEEPEEEGIYTKDFNVICIN